MKKNESTDMYMSEINSDNSNIAANPLAPYLPAGMKLGKESMVVALSNDVLDALPLENVKSGAQDLFHYLTSHAAMEIFNAIEAGTYDYSDTQVKRFSLNMHEYKDFCDQSGKKHYTMEELNAFCGEILNLPIDFMGENSDIFMHAVPIPSISLDVKTGECNYVITNEFLLHWAPGLSEQGKKETEQHYLSLKESFKFNGYQERLYRLINGHMQTLSSEYSISIGDLKIRMGVKQGTSVWNNNNRFIQRVLTPSCEAINDKSDIRFEYRVQKQEKSARIKNIVFYAFKRIKNNMAEAKTPVIEGSFREIPVSSSPEQISLTPGELKLVEFIKQADSMGISVGDAIDIYNLYGGDTGKITHKIGLFETMLKAGFLKEDNKAEFLKNMEIV